MLTPEELAAIVSEAVKAATAPLHARITTLEGLKALVPRDGRDGTIGPQGPPGDRGEKGDRGEPGPAGWSADLEIVKTLVADAVRVAVEALPRPKDGRDGVDGKDGAPGPVGDRGEKGERGDGGPEGPSGPQGAPGRDGRDGVQGPQGEKGLDGQHGKDGRDGVDGKDGLGFDDFEKTLEDGGRFEVHTYRSGDREKTFRLKTDKLIYRGVFEEGKTYEPGDVTTWGGSMFCAKETTTRKPEVDTADGRKAWQLCVQRGREGKRGEKGEQGPQGFRGEKGDPGRGHY